MISPFCRAQWLWTTESLPNHYVLFAYTATPPRPVKSLRLLFSASYVAEVWVDGVWAARGPVHGDAQWQHFEDVTITRPDPEAPLHVAALVHHSPGKRWLSQLAAPGGFIAELLDEQGQVLAATDAGWRCLTLPMWSQQAPPRGYNLGFLTDYDAQAEPPGWADKRFAPETIASWPAAVVVADAERLWRCEQPRITPPLLRQLRTGQRFCCWRAADTGPEAAADLCAHADEEPLEALDADWRPFSLDALNAAMNRANAFTLDLGAEWIGHYDFEVDVPPGCTIEVYGAETLRDGRPWIHRRQVHYGCRYRTRPGRQRFTSFEWNGFRYLHVVIRPITAGIAWLQVGCLAKQADLTPAPCPAGADEPLRKIYELCRHTLAVGAQEHLIDCPTREQLQYWGDAVFIAQSLAVGFAKPSYLRWYLECYLHVPLMPNGLISSVYPGDHGGSCLLDYALIPLIGQQFHRENSGIYYRPAETLAKAELVDRWLRARRNADGLVAFDQQRTLDEQKVRIFIDHPGIGWHDFDHPGIDRYGVSCGLNLFYANYLRVMGDLAADTNQPERAAAYYREADTLSETIRNRFCDGALFHDVYDDSGMGPGTSWQTNSLAVLFDVAPAAQHRSIMQAMLDGYDRLCRCTPYFHFYFLPALAKAGLHAEALQLIKRLWRPMIDAEATTTWECFGGGAKDSLCHPWSTPPLLYMLTYGADPAGARPASA